MGWRPALKVSAVALVLGVAFYIVGPPWREGDRLREEVGRSLFTMIDLLFEDKVDAISIYDDWHEGRLLSETKDKESIGDFIAALQQAEPWVPNHPSFTRTFYVVLSLDGGDPLEYEMGMKRDSVIYIYLVRRDGNRLSYYGRARSAALYGWFSKQAFMRGG